jgi:DNA repair exonuclease SbcCD ATPase subunit
VSSTTIRFDTEKVNKDDSIKQEIRLVITQNGNPLSFRQLSGGQQAAIELATDLALANVIGQRTGVRLNFYIADEPIPGLDPESAEYCLEVLKLASRDRLIFVIDHSVENKELFDSFIEVENVNGVSTLKQWTLN